MRPTPPLRRHVKQQCPHQPVRALLKSKVAKGYFLPPKPLKRALKRSTRPALSMMRCLPV